MYSANVDYYRAASATEAVKLLKKHPGAKLLAGGHSLIPSMKLRVTQPTALVDIGRIAELSGIKLDGKSLKIGALTHHSAVAASELVKKHCHILAEAAGLIGDPQVRNRGTIGGSLAQSDPAADYPTVITALEATISVMGPKGAREIAVKDFFKDLLTTALTEDEIIMTITVPTYGKGSGGVYLKMKHPASGFAIVGVAAFVTITRGKFTNVHLAIGGATPNPVRISSVEAELKGETPDDTSIAHAIAQVPESLGNAIGDFLASADYRKNLAMVMSQRALRQAADIAMG